MTQKAYCTNGKQKNVYLWYGNNNRNPPINCLNASNNYATLNKEEVITTCDIYNDTIQYTEPSPRSFILNPEANFF